MTYHLHGYPAIIVALLAILGALHILSGIENWVLERISIDLHPLWHVIPRRFRVSVRWDRPGALVDTDDGRLGSILYILEHADASCPVALVQLYGDDDEAGYPHSEWFITPSLSPAPRKSLMYAIKALRAGEDGDSS